MEHFGGGSGGGGGDGGGGGGDDDDYNDYKYFLKKVHYISTILTLTELLT